MTRRPRRNHSPAFKAKVALAAIRGEQALVELSQQFDVHANQIKQWKEQLLEGATGVFGDEAKTEPAGPTVDVKTLHGGVLLAHFTAAPEQLACTDGIDAGDTEVVTEAAPAPWSWLGGLATADQTML